MKSSKQTGFTIVELLIVIVIIAVLATIITVVYNGIQTKAAEAVLKSDLKGAMIQLELDKNLDPNDKYPASVALANQGRGLVTSEGVAFEYTFNESTNTYCLSGISSKSGASGFHVASGTNFVQDGVCEGHQGPGQVVVKTWSGVAIGGSTACGIYGDDAYCWGAGGSGQLGNGQAVNSSIPVKVSQNPGFLSGKQVTKIAVGASHACAVAEGEAYCWGSNSVGQLGVGSTTSSSVPVKVTQASGILLGKTVTDISAGGSHSCAIADGQIYCWGGNSNGQLGISSTTASNVPAKVTQASGLLLNKTAQAISLSSGNPFTCAIASGEAFCWGFNGSRQLGDNTTTQRTSPVKVTQASGFLLGKVVTSIGTGTDHACAVANNEAYCWGANASGQLGNGTLTNSATPIKVTQANGLLLGKSATVIAAGGDHTCVVANGEAYCWGYGLRGQLGTGSSAQLTTPGKVVQNVGALSGKTVTKIAAASGANSFTCSQAEGDLFCWGYNASGQLGDNSNSNSQIPVKVTNP